MAITLNKSIYKILFTLGLVICVSSSGYSQVKDEIHESIMAFMDDLNAGDSAKVRSYFVPNAMIYHVDKDTLVDLTIDDFVAMLSDFKSKRFQEDFFQIDVSSLDNGFAHSDVKFRFFIEGEMAFQGNDHYIWVQRGDKMMIQSIHSSRLPIKPTLTASPGSDDPINQLNNLMNKWHKDVAMSRLEDYFSFMDESFYFLGTDPSERWSKKEFLEFCKPYFEKQETWHFIPNWRNWYFSWDNQTAWFEESLDTWMEECRASGVCVKVNGEWKIVHYNLTVLIENDKIQKFIKLRQKD